MKKIYFLVLILLGIHLFFLVNLQFTAWPEMFSYAYLRNHGFLLYKDMIHPYPPLLTIFLSIIYSIFGYKLEILQILAWGNILSGSFLLFLVSKAITGRNDLSILALTVYVFLQPFLEGDMLWFDLAIVPPVLLGIFFFMKTFQARTLGVSSGKVLQTQLIFAGFILALASLIKQTAAIFLIISAAFLFFRHRSLKEVWLLSVGSIVLLAPLSIRLIQEGTLVNFLNWTFLYPIGEWTKYPNYVQMSLTPREWLIMGIFLLLLLIALIIVRRTILADPRLQFLALFLFGSIIAVYPRFSFFHFQLALALIIIIFIYALKNWTIKKVVIILLFLLIVLSPFVHEPALVLAWHRQPRFYGNADLKLTHIIQKETTKNEKVFLQGLHSGLYVLSGRIPSKPWSDNFGWYLEIPGVQEKILTRWKNDPPEYIFWRTPLPGNWFDLGTYQPQQIAAWIEENYTKEKEVEPGIWLWRKQK